MTQKRKRHRAFKIKLAAKIITDIKFNVRLTKYTRKSFLIHCKEDSNYIPRSQTERPCSQFPYSYICERFIYFQDLSTYLAAAK
jgi:hypothetical protein